MGNVNDRDAALFEFAEQLEEVFAFADGKGAGWFVHHDDLGLRAECGGDLDKLLLACRELADGLIDVKIGFDFAQHRTSQVAHFPPVEPAGRAAFTTTV